MAALLKKRIMYGDPEEEFKNNKEIKILNNSCDDDKVFCEKIFYSLTRSPQDSDFQGIKSLLKEIFPNAHIDLDSLIRLIISKCTCQVLKQVSSLDEDADEINDPIDVYGVSTFIGVKQNVNCILQLREHLMDLTNQYALDSTKAEIIKILKDNTIQLELLINEKNVAIPAEMAITPLEDLFINIQQSRCESILNSTYVICICKIFKITKKYNNELNSNDIIKKEKILWLNLVEKVIAKQATYSFEYSVDSELVSELPNKLWVDGPDYWDPYDYDNVVPYRRMLIFEIFKWKKIIKKMKKKFNYSE